MRRAGVEGLALSDLGRFIEATVAHFDSWKLARELGNIELEGWAIKRAGDLWGAMAQFDVAMIYLDRSRQLAAENALLDLELSSRDNLANCAKQLRDPEAGLRALLPLPTVCTRRGSTCSGKQTLMTSWGICIG